MDRDSISILLPRDMSRRRFNQLLLAGMGTALTGACGDDKALDLFTWSTWGEPGFIDEARAKLGVELRSTFYSSSDEMMAKLRGGGTRIYDRSDPELRAACRSGGVDRAARSFQADEQPARI